MVDPVQARKVNLMVAGMVLLVALTQAIDLITAYVKDHHVRYFSLVMCIVFVLLAATFVRRGRA